MKSIIVISLLVCTTVLARRRETPQEDFEFVEVNLNPSFYSPQNWGDTPNSLYRLV